MKQFFLFVVTAIIVFGCEKENLTIEELKSKGEKEFLSGNYRSAREIYIKALAKKPSDFDLLYFTGMCYQREYIFDSALIYFKNADLLYPRNKELNMAIYQVAPEIEDWKNAIKAIKVLIRSGESEEQYWSDLIDFHQKAGQNLHTFYYLKQIMKKDPDNLSYYLRSISATLTLNSLYVAGCFIDTATDKFGELLELRANRGILFLYKSEFKKSEAIFRTLSKEYPQNVHYKLNLANALAAQEDDRKKMMEGRNIYNEIEDALGGQYPVDSLLLELDRKLND